MMKATCALALLVFAATILSVPASAQKYYDQKGETYSQKYYEKRPDKIALALLRVPETSSENFILRLSSTHVYNGCPKLSAIENQVEFTASDMRVYIGPYTVDMRDLPDNPHYECGGKMISPTAEISLSRDMFEDKNIKYIRFRNATQTDSYTVTLTDRYLELKPDEDKVPQMLSHIPQDVYKVKNPLKYWFYPENTVQLYLPGMNKVDPAAMKKLEALAANHDLTPLTDIYPDFEPPLVDSPYIYYVDKNNALPDDAVTQNGSHILGTIKVKKTVYGLEGEDVKMAPIQVFVKRPGIYE